MPVLDSYARLSRNLSGKLEKVETQHTDNGGVITRLGGVLGEQISDNSLSAWNPKVRRPGWERLMERVAARACDGVVIWNTDRAMRLMIDLETLFSLVDDSFLLGSSHGRYDLSDYNDRHQLRTEVSHAQRCSDEASHRIKRRFEMMRSNGVPHHQGRVFGFPGLDRTVGRAAPGRGPVSAVLVARERAALVEATGAVLAGATLAGISREWNEAGLRTATGRLWIPAMVREVLLRPRNAGLIEHDGEVVGRMAGDPVVDSREFERLRVLLAGRKSGQRPGAYYLASGIALCGVCGKALSGRPHTGQYPDGDKRRQYGCTKTRGGCGKVAADVRAVDRELRALVISVLSDAKHAAAIKAARARISVRLGQVETEIAECEERQEAIAEKFGARKMTERAFDKANDPLMADLARLYAERDALTGGHPDGPTEAMTVTEATEQWERADNAARRALLTEALGRTKLYIDPAERSKPRRFTSTRIRVEPSPRPVEALSEGPPPPRGQGRTGGTLVEVLRAPRLRPALSGCLRVVGLCLRGSLYATA
ncbi:MAG: recombinase family protein [Pseudonocardiaceae bacterium]